METKHTSYSTDELLGRALLQHIIPKIYNRDKYDLATYISDIQDTTHYDAFISMFDKVEGSYKGSHIIEVKVRDLHYSEMIYEKYKHNKLTNILTRYHNVADIIYINTTPEGTYVWNITKMEKENLLDWVTMPCNKSTVEDYKGKTDKIVALLPIKLAKYIPITNTFISDKLKEERKEIEEAVKEQQRQKCLYQWLLTPSQLKGEIKKNVSEDENNNQ